MVTDPARVTEVFAPRRAILVHASTSILVGFAVWFHACGQHPGELDCARKPKRAAGAPPPFELVTLDADRSEMAHGYALMNQNDGELSWATVIDGCAEHQWWRPATHPSTRVIRAHRSLDGKRVLMAEHNRAHRPDLGMLQEIDIASNALVRSTRIEEAHHDFRELEGGQVAWISWQYIDNDWFERTSADLVTDVVRTTQLGTEEALDQRLFSLFDDSGAEPWWTCGHMSPSDSIPGYAEWSHSNSLLSVPSQHRLYLHARHWDALLAVDRSTGELLWTLGGQNSDFEAINGATFPDHAHLSELWEDGMLLFDNRNHHPSGTSRVVEYRWDEEARTVEEVWAYTDGSFSGFLGDAARLPGGNVLISWSTSGRLVEVTRGGDIVWEAKLDLGLSRVEFHPSWPGLP
jgi:hypothetical protein